MSNLGNDWKEMDALTQALEEGRLLKLRGKDFDNFVDHRADELLGELPDADDYLHDYEDRVCRCGEWLEDCPDAYEHMTQGV